MVDLESGRLEDVEVTNEVLYSDDAVSATPGVVVKEIEMGEIVLWLLYRVLVATVVEYDELKA